jgi:hypothetical protein
LDPAGPLFYKFDPAVRIDSQDAVFVDIIHTDGTREYYIQIYRNFMGYYTLLLASTCSNLQWMRYIIYLHSHKQNMNIVEIKQQNKNKNVAHIFSILLVFFNTFCLRFVSSTLCWYSYCFVVAWLFCL